MISLQPSHLTHSPSGTVLRRRSARIGLGCLAFLNQTMGNNSRAASAGGAHGMAAAGRAGRAARLGAGLGEEGAAWGAAVLGSGSDRGGGSRPGDGSRETRRGAGLESEAGGVVPLLSFQVVGDPEAHAGGVVHLTRGLLRVLQLREAVLDLGQLVLDRPVELLHLLLGHLQRILVEFSLLLGKAHGSLPITPRPRAPTASGPGRLAYRPSRL